VAVRTLAAGAGVQAGRVEPAAPDAPAAANTIAGEAA
jgi:hypothetical protein